MLMLSHTQSSHTEPAHSERVGVSHVREAGEVPAGLHKKHSSPLQSRHRKTHFTLVFGWVDYGDGQLTVLALSRMSTVATS